MREEGLVPQLASVADRFQMTEATSVLEEALTGKAQRGRVRGRSDVERTVRDATAGGRSLEMAAKRFEEFEQTAGFARMGEEALMMVMDGWPRGATRRCGKLLRVG